MLPRHRRLTDFDTLIRDVDRLMGEVSRPGAFAPRTDVVETADAYVLSLDVPGMSRDALRLHYDDGVLTIAGERTISEAYGEARVHRVERAYGRFSRQFTLGTAIDPDAIDASLDDGVLTIRVPKAEVRKPRQISIGARSPEASRHPGATDVEVTDAPAREPANGTAHEATA